MITTTVQPGSTLVLASPHIVFGVYVKLILNFNRDLACQWLYSISHSVKNYSTFLALQTIFFDLQIMTYTPFMINQFFERASHLNSFVSDIQHLEVTTLLLSNGRLHKSNKKLLEVVRFQTTRIIVRAMRVLL